MDGSGKKPARYYPLFLSIEGRTCLVAGGGAVAERKVETLLGYGAHIRLIALDISAQLRKRCSEGSVTWAGLRYAREHLQGVCLVFAATSDKELNRTIAADAAALGLWCNMASDPELGTFIVPSVVERGPLSIAMSTSGLSPAIAKRLRCKLESEIGAEWELFIRFLGALREMLKSRNVNPDDSRRILGDLSSLPIPEWLKEGGKDKAFLKISETCSPLLNEADLQPVWDNLWKPSSW
ncbi:MAG: bifunctional precorrin-2 dehydrogenase/sirohydrochlorin ferrochelatase [Desulfobacteraceae bacterium]|nr:bifunctional precorrin-2 dehydrogenase/sirohydrochlorin ferrochelatase [Desulfobacteraceae bacterium]